MQYYLSYNHNADVFTMLLRYLSPWINICIGSRYHLLTLVCTVCVMFPPDPVLFNRVSDNVRCPMAM